MNAFAYSGIIAAAAKLKVVDGTGEIRNVNQERTLCLTEDAPELSMSDFQALRS